MTPAKDMTDRRAKEQWHFGKEIPLSLMFAMLVQVVVIVWAIAGIKGDVENLKANQLSQHDRDERQDRAAAESFTLVRLQLEKLELKLDRALERRP